MPDDGRWVCIDCGYIMYGDEPTLCESCGSSEMDEEHGDYEEGDEEPEVPWIEV